jgi:hypothetical protein
MRFVAILRFCLLEFSIYPSIGAENRRIFISLENKSRIISSVMMRFPSPNERLALETIHF